MSNSAVETVNTKADKAKVFLAIAVFVAGVVAFYFLANKPMVMRLGALLGGIALALILAWFSVPGREFIGFAKDAYREVKKVVWPSRKETLQTTAAVFAFVVIMALFLWFTDKTLEFVLYDLILGWKK